MYSIPRERTKEPNQCHDRLLIALQGNRPQFGFIEIEKAVLGKTITQGQPISKYPTALCKLKTAKDNGCRISF